MITPRWFLKVPPRRHGGSNLPSSARTLFLYTFLTCFPASDKLLFRHGPLGTLGG